MEHLSNDQEDHPNKHENSCKLYDEKGHPLLSLKESKWKFSEFSNTGKAIVEQILESEERNRSKKARLRVTVRYPKSKVNHLSKVA